MSVRVITIVLAVLLAVPAISPEPALAGSDPDRVPGWVSWSVVGAFVVGGAFFLNHLHQRSEVAAMTPEQRARDLVSHLATEEERSELGKLSGDREVSAFLDRFYARRDPTPGTPQNEFRDEQLDRYREANELYGSGPLAWSSDRRRIYFVYGPPATMRQLEVRAWPDRGNGWRSVEIWQYEAAAGANPLPPILRDPGLFDAMFREPAPTHGQKLFLFVNDAGEGFYRLGFSTEAGEAFDHSVYRVGTGGN